jgi:hypothetical protein
MDYLYALKQLRGKQNRELDKHTFLEMGTNDVIGLRFYATTIIKYHPDGSIKLAVNGYYTPQTLEKLNDNLFDVVVSKVGTVWVVSKIEGNATRYLFKDNMTIGADGSIDTTPYAVVEMQKVSVDTLTTLEDVIRLIQGSTIKALKVMWRRCKCSREVIAYYAALEFIPLILPTATGDEYWYRTAKERLANG